MKLDRETSLRLNAEEPKSTKRTAIEAIEPGDAVRLLVDTAFPAGTVGVVKRVSPGDGPNLEDILHVHIDGMLECIARSKVELVGPGVQPAPQTTQEDVQKAGALASELKTSMICDEAGMMLAHVRRAEAEEAMQRAEAIIRHIASLCADYGVDLTELLPTVTCSRCTRPTIEYRTFRNFELGSEEIVCILCIDAQLTSVRRVDAPNVMTRALCLDRAKELVVGSRADAYGPPTAAFQRIAALWTTILGARVDAHRVALCMMALKIARLVENPRHADSWIDAAGYAACGGEVSR